MCLGGWVKAWGGRGGKGFWGLGLREGFLAGEAEGGFGEGAEAWEGDGGRAGAADAVGAVCEGGEGGADVGEASLVLVAVGLGHLLVLEGVHAGEAADGLVEVDRAGGLFGVVDQGFQLLLEGLEGAAKLGGLIGGQVVHGRRSGEECGRPG